MPLRILVLITIALLAQRALSETLMHKRDLAWVEEAPLKLLEKRRDLIQIELHDLAEFNFHNGVGAICYRSMPTSDPHSPEWVQIDFDQRYLIEEIVLVPTIWHVNGKGYQDDGFPRSFQIYGGTSDESGSHLIAEIEADEADLPRVAPLIIADINRSLDWIRIEATELTTRAHDGNYILQFSEIMAFTPIGNVALGQTATASSEQRGGNQLDSVLFQSKGGTTMETSQRLAQILTTPFREYYRRKRV